jgi:hypothetical protein
MRWAGVFAIVLLDPLWSTTARHDGAYSSSHVAQLPLACSKGDMLLFQLLAILTPQRPGTAHKAILRFSIRLVSDN